MSLSGLQQESDRPAEWTLPLWEVWPRIPQLQVPPDAPGEYPDQISGRFLPRSQHNPSRESFEGTDESVLSVCLCCLWVTGLFSWFVCSTWVRDVSLSWLAVCFPSAPIKSFSLCQKVAASSVDSGFQVYYAVQSTDGLRLFSSEDKLK